MSTPPPDQPNTRTALPDLAKLPGCLFAPRNVRPRSLFANDASGVCVHVSQVETSAKGLTCPDCDTPVIARKGKSRRHHFSHKSGDDCRTAGETALHLMAKQIIAGGDALSLPAIWVQVPRGFRPLRPVTLAAFRRVEIEPWENGVRPDLVGYESVIQKGCFDEPRLLIEIRVTHEVGGDKKENYRCRGEPVLEINLSKVARGLSYEELARQILADAPREWLVHPAIDEYPRQEEQRQAEEARSNQEKRDAHRAAQARARQELPRPSTEAERRQALTERHRWLSVGAPDPLSLPADDAIFAVEPLLWRTAALEDLAPWNMGHYGKGNKAPPRLPVSGTGDFCAPDYVKPAFLPGGSSIHGHSVPEAPQVSEVLAGFRQAALKGIINGAPNAARDLRRPNLAKDSRALLIERWDRITRLRDPLIRAIEILRTYGLEILATAGREPRTLEAPRRLRTKADVDALLATGWVNHRPGAEGAVRALMGHLEAGSSSCLLIETLVASLTQQGLAVATPGSANLSQTFEVLQPVLADLALQVQSRG